MDDRSDSSGFGVFLHLLLAATVAGASTIFLGHLLSCTTAGPTCIWRRESDGVEVLIQAGHVGVQSGKMTPEHFRSITG